jgi:hypothetical protein
MKSLLLHGALVVLPLSSPAFLSVAQEVAIQLSRSSNIASRSNQKRTVSFDPVSQLVDVTGQHAFTPSNCDTEDQRGPCPGLNTLANHNYLPHNGVAAWTDIMDQTVAGVYTYSIISKQLSDSGQSMALGKISQLFSPFMVPSSTATSSHWIQVTPSVVPLHRVKIFLGVSVRWAHLKASLDHTTNINQMPLLAEEISVPKEMITKSTLAASWPSTLFNPTKLRPLMIFQYGLNIARICS